MEQGGGGGMVLFFLCFSGWQSCDFFVGVFASFSFLFLLSGMGRNPAIGVWLWKKDESCEVWRRGKSYDGVRLKKKSEEGDSFCCQRFIDFSQLNLVGSFPVDAI